MSTSYCSINFGESSLRLCKVTCYTEMAAEKIRDIIGPELVTLH
ncbi:hypothetical protein ACUOFC_45985, partial [Escherichia sp. TWPC-MK]